METSIREPEGYDIRTLMSLVVVSQLVYVVLPVKEDDSYETM
jgi:hypothetical protein|tara:strand:- start:125 stop:250 length:126 start_codon:yes stop_codon:yes gene_type:complete